MFKPKQQTNSSRENFCRGFATSYGSNHTNKLQSLASQNKLKCSDISQLFELKIVLNCQSISIRYAVKPV